MSLGWCWGRQFWVCSLTGSHALPWWHFQDRAIMWSAMARCSQVFFCVFAVFSLTVGVVSVFRMEGCQPRPQTQVTCACCFLPKVRKGNWSLGEKGWKTGGGISKCWYFKNSISRGFLWSSKSVLLKNMISGTCSSRNPVQRNTGTRHQWKAICFDENMLYWIMTHDRSYPHMFIHSNCATSRMHWSTVPQHTYQR